MEIKQDIRYQQGKIYKIVCNITNEIYYGSTIETLEERLRGHKKKCCSSRNIIERGDYEMILIKNYPCNNVWELEEEEGKYIRENECINIAIPHRTQEEWREENKKEISEKKKQDRINNLEKYKQISKNTYEKHKEKINEKKNKIEKLILKNINNKNKIEKINKKGKIKKKKKLLVNVEQ